MSHRSPSFWAITSCRVSCHTAASPTPASGLTFSGILPLIHASMVLRPRPGRTLTVMAGKLAVRNAQDCASPETASVAAIGATRMPATSSGFRICLLHADWAALRAAAATSAGALDCEGTELLEQPTNISRAQPNKMSPSLAAAIVTSADLPGPSSLRGAPDRPDPVTAPGSSYRLHH